MSLLGIKGNIFNRAFSGEISDTKKDMLSKIKDPALRAQSELQIMAEIESVIARTVMNLIRVFQDTAKHISDKIR